MQTTHSAAYATFTFAAILNAYASPTTVSLEDDVMATTTYGKLRGVRVREIYDLKSAAVTDTVDTFLGIPYARPPTGNRRLRPPEPPVPWRGVRAAREFGWVCPQVQVTHPTRTALQREDCLYLNVYSPVVTGDGGAPYPVMVFIHGGSFEVGSGKQYDGTVLAQLGVVMVTINYRLGALGFLTSGDSLLPGNFGLMDQVQALRWVRDNIAGFRGDPRNVVVFGHSAGGSSVGLHLLLPQTKGLIRGVIAESGSAVASYAIHDSSQDWHQYVRDVGRLFGCVDVARNVSNVISCLRRIDSRDLIERRRSFPRYDAIDPEFRPFLDGEWVTDYPRCLFQNGHFHKVPIILGTVMDEFGNYFNGGARHNPLFDVALDNYVAKSVNRRSDLVDVIQFEYTAWDAVEYKGHDRGALLSDMHMVAPTVDMAELLSRHSNQVYQYHFTVPGSYHSIELNYVFGAPFSGRYADEMTGNSTLLFSTQDKELSIRVMTMWTNLAKFGEPTPTGSSVEDIKWPNYSPEGKSYLSLNPQGVTSKQRLRHNKVVFWNHVIPKLKQFNQTNTSTSCGHAATFDMVRVGEPAEVAVNLWVFIAVTVVLVAMVFILAVFLIRTSVKGQEYKKALAAVAVVGANNKDIMNAAKV